MQFQIRFRLRMDPDESVFCNAETFQEVDLFARYVARLLEFRR